MLRKLTNVSKFQVFFCGCGTRSSVSKLDSLALTAEPLTTWKERSFQSIYNRLSVSQCCQSVVLTVILCLFVSRRVSFGYRYKCRLKTTVSLVVVVSMSLFRFGVGDDVGTAKRGGRPRKSNVNPVSEVQESQQSLTSGLAGLQVEEEVIQPIRVISPPVSGNFHCDYCSI